MKMRVRGGNKATKLSALIKEKMDNDISLTKEYVTGGVAIDELGVSAM